MTETGSSQPENHDEEVIPEVQEVPVDTPEEQALMESGHDDSDSVTNGEAVPPEEEFESKLSTLPEDAQLELRSIVEGIRSQGELIKVENSGLEIKTWLDESEMKLFKQQDGKQVNVTDSYTDLSEQQSHLAELQELTERRFVVRLPEDTVRVGAENGTLDSGQDKYYTFKFLDDQNNLHVLVYKLDEKSSAPSEREIGEQTTSDNDDENKSNADTAQDIVFDLNESLEFTTGQPAIPFFTLSQSSDRLTTANNLLVVETVEPTFFQNLSSQKAETQSGLGMESGVQQSTTEFLEVKNYSENTPDQITLREPVLSSTRALGQGQLQKSVARIETSSILSGTATQNDFEMRLSPVDQNFGIEIVTTESADGAIDQIAQTERVPTFDIPSFASIPDPTESRSPANFKAEIADSSTLSNTVENNIVLQGEIIEEESITVEWDTAHIPELSPEPYVSPLIEHAIIDEPVQTISSAATSAVRNGSERTDKMLPTEPSSPNSPTDYTPPSPTPAPKLDKMLQPNPPQLRNNLIEKSPHENVSSEVRDPDLVVVPQIEIKQNIPQQNERTQEANIASAKKVSPEGNIESRFQPKAIQNEHSATQSAKRDAIRTVVDSEQKIPQDALTNNINEIKSSTKQQEATSPKQDASIIRRAPARSRIQIAPPPMSNSEVSRNRVERIQPTPTAPVAQGRDVPQRIAPRASSGVPARQAVPVRQQATPERQPIQEADPIIRQVETNTTAQRADTLQPSKNTNSIIGINEVRRLSPTPTETQPRENTSARTAFERVVEIRPNPNLNEQMRRRGPAITNNPTSTQPDDTTALERNEEAVAVAA